jgi:hypothetical protein
MIGCHQHRPLGIVGIDQCAEARETAQQVVQSGRGDPGLIHACNGGCLHVIQRQLIVHNTRILPLGILRGEALSQPRLEIKLLGIPQHNQRHHIFLRVDTALLVGVPVQMNRQTWHHCDRAARIK